MDAVSRPFHYGLEERKPFGLSIPVISFTPVANESTSQTKEDLALDKYNNNHECKQLNINNNYEKSSSTTKLAADSRLAADTPNPDASLPDRLREISKCIKWIHSEMKTMSEERDSLTQRFYDLELEIREIYMALPTSPYASYDGSFLSLNEESSDRLHLSDQFEYEFRARTSSLLLPSRSTLSPSPSRKTNASTTYRRCNLIRPKSLTHIHTDSAA